MQMYPGGGYAQQCYTGIPDDEDEYMDHNDYHYDAFGHQSMPMMLEKGVSHHSMQKTLDKGVPHRSMQKMLNKGVPHPKQNYMWDNNYGNDEYHYNGVSTMEMKPNHQWRAPQKDDYEYNNTHGYGGYNQNFDNFKHGHEDYSNVQYNEEWSESEEEHHSWKGSNDHFGPGKHQNANKYSGMSYGVEKSGGYGAYQGPHMPMAEKRPRHKPVAPQMWSAKAVKD